MGYNLNIDTDNEGALQLAMQGQQIPSWVYENSQIAHENKRIRLVALQLEAVEEAQQKQRGQLQKQEKESKTISLISINVIRQKSKKMICYSNKKDLPS